MVLEIRQTGDPFNKSGWDIFELSADGETTWFRGDLSPSHGRDRTIRMLSKLYPGCTVRVQD